MQLNTLSKRHGPTVACMALSHDLIPINLIVITNNRFPPFLIFFQSQVKKTFSLIPPSFLNHIIGSFCHSIYFACFPSIILGTSLSLNACADWEADLKLSVGGFCWLFLNFVLVVLQKRTRFVALPDEIIAWLFLPDETRAAVACNMASMLVTVREPEDVDWSAGSETLYPTVVFLGCGLGSRDAHLLPVAGCGFPVLPPTTWTGASSFFVFTWCGLCMCFILSRLSCSSCLDVGSRRSLEYK